MKTTDLHTVASVWVYFFIFYVYCSSNTSWDIAPPILYYCIAPPILHGILLPQYYIIVLLLQYYIIVLLLQYYIIVLLFQYFMGYCSSNTSWDITVSLVGLQHWFHSKSVTNLCAVLASFRRFLSGWCTQSYWKKLAHTVGTRVESNSQRYIL